MNTEYWVVQWKPGECWVDWYDSPTRRKAERVLLERRRLQPLERWQLIRRVRNETEDVAL